MTDNELTAELQELWVSGAVHLPTMAVPYANASRSVNNTSWKDREAFTHTEVQVTTANGYWPTVDVVEVQSPAMEPILELRDGLQHLLVDTAAKLENAGRALVQIGEAYAEDDSQTAEAFERQWEQYQAEEPSITGPPEVPEAKEPGSTVEVEDSWFYGEEVPKREQPPE